MRINGSVASGRLVFSARLRPGGRRVALGARLEVRQGQSLVITPQLQQAIKLLQLSNMELEAYVEGELEKNPLLQRDEPDGAPEERRGERDEPQAEVSHGEVELTDGAGDRSE